jgi:hypothetical protein
MRIAAVAAQLYDHRPPVLRHGTNSRHRRDRFAASGVAAGRSIAVNDDARDDEEPLTAASLVRGEHSEGPADVTSEWKHCISPLGSLRIATETG